MKKSAQAVIVATSAMTVLSSVPTGAIAHDGTTVAENPTPGVVAARSDVPKTQIDRTPAKSLAEAQATLDKAKSLSEAAQKKVDSLQDGYDKATAQT
mgnify:FL=1